jgi:hypothetical protein
MDKKEEIMDLLSLMYLALMILGQIRRVHKFPESASWPFF